MDASFTLAVVALTSLGTYLLGTAGLGLLPGRLGHALAWMFEAVGLTIVFLALNLAAGLVVVLVLRAATGQFVSLYAVDDPTCLGFSLLQALAFQRWRESR